MLNIYWLPLFDFVFPGVLQKVRLITRLKNHTALRDGMVKCEINQIASLIKVSILNATNRKAVGSTAMVHAGRIALERED